MLLSLGAVVGGLLLIVGVITWKGIGALSLDMVTKLPSGGYFIGKGGGLLNAIVGSLLLGVGATVCACVLALPVSLYLQRDYAGGRRRAGLVRMSLNLLWGVPSIVYGAVGLMLMMYLGARTPALGRSSLLWGIVCLTLVELPIMARAMEEVLRMVSVELREAAYSVGATRWETMRSVVLRQALPGLFTAVLLAFGRGIGDAASVLFTAGYAERLPHSLLDQVASLPLAVFFLLSSPFPEVQKRAYAAAFILLAIVLVISVVSRVFSARAGRFAVK
jgi:phosphate transport system permease protein